MTNFLKKLSDNTCNANQEYITQNNTYVIDSGKYLVVNATGTVLLNYTNIEYQNQIYPQNISSSQTIEVYGYTSESVSGDATCPLQTNTQNEVKDITEVASLIIYLVEFGIEVFSQIVFGLSSPSTQDLSDPVTVIELDNGQNIVLYNVSQSALTEANFIFATSSDNTASSSGSDNGFWNLGSELGIGLGGGAFVILSGIGIYMYVNQVGPLTDQV